MAQRQTHQHDTSALRVLIADDNADARLLLHTYLSRLGFEVCSAADGSEALTYAEHFKPDIVFLDVWMPGMDGIEACTRLRAGPCPQSIPIYAITADAWGSAAACHCFDRVLAKPVDLDRLASIVRQRAQAIRH